jgi:hypothetical protein
MYGRRFEDHYYLHFQSEENHVSGSAEQLPEKISFFLISGLFTDISIVQIIERGMIIPPANNETYRSGNQRR